MKRTFYSGTATTTSISSSTNNNNNNNNNSNNNRKNTTDIINNTNDNNKNDTLWKTTTASAALATTITTTKDWIDYRKLEEYILNEELPSNAIQRAIDSMKDNSGYYYYATYREEDHPSNHRNTIASTDDDRMEYDNVKCTCPYLLEYLPEKLDLKYVQRIRRIPTNHKKSSLSNIHNNRSLSSRSGYDDIITTDDDGPTNIKIKNDSDYNNNYYKNTNMTDSNKSTTKNSLGVTISGTKFDPTTMPNAAAAGGGILLEYEWVLENPITALHMISQVIPFNVLSNNTTMSIEKVFDYAGTGTFTAPTSSSSTIPPPPQQPVWYGEEQERTIVATTEGYTQFYHPLMNQTEQEYPDPLPDNTIQSIVDSTYRPYENHTGSSTTSSSSTSNYNKYNSNNNKSYQKQQQPPPPPPPPPKQGTTTATGLKGSAVPSPARYPIPPPPPTPPPKPKDSSSSSSSSKKDTSDSSSTPTKKKDKGSTSSTTTTGTPVSKGKDSTVSNNNNKSNSGATDPKSAKKLTSTSHKKSTSKLPITKGTGSGDKASSSSSASKNAASNNKSSSNNSPNRNDSTKGTSTKPSVSVKADPVVSSSIAVSPPPRSTNTNNKQPLPTTSSSSTSTLPQQQQRQKQHSTKKDSGNLAPIPSSSTIQPPPPPPPTPPPVIVPPLPDPVYWSLLSRNEHIDAIQSEYLSKRGPYVPPGSTAVSPVKTTMMNNPPESFSTTSSSSLYQPTSKKSKLNPSSTTTTKSKSNSTNTAMITNPSKSKSKNKSAFMSDNGFHGPLTIRQYLQIWKDNQTKNLFTPAYPMKLVPVGTNKVMLPIPALAHTPVLSLNNINNERTIMTSADEIRWKENGQNSITKVELWMENYRYNRTLYWQRRRNELQEQEKQQQQSIQGKMTVTTTSTSTNDDIDVIVDDVIGNSERKLLHQTFGTIQDNNTSSFSTSNSFSAFGPSKKLYTDDTDLIWSSLFGDGSSTSDYYNDDGTTSSLPFDNGDEYMQCLECTFVGLAPGMKSTCGGCRLKSFSKQHQEQHIVQHMLQSNHNFAVSCGPKARIYSFKNGDYIYHRVFEQEKYRIDIMENMPVMGWHKHPINRSFDIFQFIHIPDQGIFWNGIKATYPVPVPKEHLTASYLCRQRQIMFSGKIDELSLVSKANTNKHCIEFTALQNRRHAADRCRITAPIGFYNLGHTCAMSAVLQCLIHCAPLQKFFLHDIGFHYEACRTYRQMPFPEMIPILETGNDNLRLASEMDKLFLRYFSSTIAYDVFSAVRGSAKDESNGTSGLSYQGQPLLINDMLTTVWRCRGMRHLAGYDQRDAHEFLHAFLDNLGKGTQSYYNMIQLALNRFKLDTGDESDDKKNTKSSYDIVKKLFEGTLRSILVCQECGNKRVQLEPFLSISLPLSKEVQKLAKEIGDNRKQPGTKLSIDRCLKHFTMAELLADHVFCPACAKKTPTKKQHVVARLPKVLCLHLKRFDASQNRKIEDFVSFPGRGLNMGPYLPHWSEVSKALSDTPHTEGTLPNILYDLFGTVNHHGNLESGHYVANVRIRDKWFHCNDSSVASASKTDAESAVLDSEGAYLLFYVRKDKSY